MKHRVLLLALAVLLFAGMGAAQAIPVTDGFEDGDYTNNPSWTEARTGGGSATVQTGTVKEGTNALEFTTDGAGDFATIGLDSPPIDPFNFTDGTTASTWVRSGNAANGRVRFRLTGANNEFANLLMYEGTFRVSTDVETSSTFSATPSSDTWYKFEITTHNSSDTVDFAVYDSSGSLIEENNSVKATVNFDTVELTIDDNTGSSYNAYFDDSFYGFELNNPPVIDANTTRPSPSQVSVGDSVDTVVNATEPDGDPCNGWVTVNEDGTDIVSDKSMAGTGNCDFQDLDTFTADEINVWYNITYTVGDGTANTTEDTLRIFNEDNPPTVTINDPGNVTLYDYDNHLLNATIDDDLSTWANISVTLDGNNIVNGFNRTVKYFTTNTTRDDLGTHNLSVKAWDDQQQTTLAWEVFTVDDLKFFGTANITPTFETRNESFNSSHKVGDMVNELNTTLYWNNTDRFQRDRAPSGITTFNDSHYFEIPLVDNNNTFVNWTIQRRINRTDFTPAGGGSYTTETVNITKFGNQSVFHAYSFDNSELIPDSNYTVGDDYTHRVNLTNRSDKATVTTTNTYWRTLNTVTNGFVKTITPQTQVFELGQAVGNVTTGLFDQYNTSTEFKIEFNGRTRFFNSTNDTVGIRQVKLQECSQFTQSSTVALNFTTRPENDRDNLAFSDLTGAFTVWKHPSQKASYNFSSTDQRFHEFCIFPEDENLTVDNTDKLIQYEGSRPNPDDGIGFERRSYFLINETVLHTSTSDINLFMINETDATTVEYQIENEDGDLATGIVVKIERYFESEDKHLVVSMIRTGSEGTSRTFLEKNEFYYQHRLFRDMEQVDIKEDQVIPEDNQFNFQIGGETSLDYYERKDDVSFSCTDATTYINCSYSSDTEQLENVNLTVKRNDVVGQTLIDFTTATTTSGEVAVTGLNTTNTTYTYAFNAEFPEGTILLESGFLGTGDDLFGNTGLSLSLFLMLGLGFAGIAIAPEAVIILSMLGVVATATIDIIAIQMQHVFGLILIAAVALWRMMR